MYASTVLGLATLVTCRDCEGQGLCIYGLRRWIPYLPMVYDCTTVHGHFLLNLV